MSSLRIRALSSLPAPGNGKPVSPAPDQAKISQIYGENVFDLAMMKEYLTGPAYRAVLDALNEGRQISMPNTEIVAAGMRKWAMDRGASHYTHWFHPWTGLTAEKHDAFFKPTFGRVVQGIENLTGLELVQQEPDASSFPNGGLRGTQEARGYTIWDPSSPAFILEIESGRTLYIPSVFISYTGESLDYKSMLLKSMDALSRATANVSQLFDNQVVSAFPTLGWEQEYFLVDVNFFNARPDLLLAGRTIVGASAAKGHGKSDHYFGVIPERVQRYMQDFEREALRVGIPIRTRHNEVAPAQFECAPMFEEMNTAVDHNLLIMGIMQRVAAHHGLRVLLHEKPFAGINGSGKHNNWSIALNTGKNVFQPEGHPAQDLHFLTFFICLLWGLNRHANVLRATVASSGNEHRLGANEAPPAIISVFTGRFMADVLAYFKENGLAAGTDALQTPVLEHCIPKIPAVRADHTDRNRTSSFPYIGNRFEFRAVGATATPAFPMSILNAIMTDALVSFRQEVDTAIGGESAPEMAQAAIVSILQRYLAESERIIFNGDGYSEQWRAEAANRGLRNEVRTPHALDFLLEPEAIEMLGRHAVLTEKEIRALVTVQKDNYCRDIETEANLMLELMRTCVLPAGMAFSRNLATYASQAKQMNVKSRVLDDTRAQVEEVARLVAEVQNQLVALEAALHRAEAAKTLDESARLFAEVVKPLFEPIRRASDRLELLVEDQEWRLPKYREILYLR